MRLNRWYAAALALLIGLSGLMAVPTVAASTTDARMAAAIPLTGVKSGSLAPGRGAWYRLWDKGDGRALGVTLNYAGDGDDADAPIAFRVYAPNRQTQDLRLTQIGEGTASGLPRGVLYWRGSSGGSSSYFFELTNVSEEAVDYAISFTGNAFPPPALPITPLPVPTPVVEETIKLSSKDGMDRFLVDISGRTLYYFAKDVSGDSACVNACVDIWPMGSVEKVAVSAPLAAADFKPVTRPDGRAQLSYRGWPLYYFSRDKKAGDALGEGVNKLWFVVKAPAYTIMLGNKADLGNYMVDANGRTLYTSTKDLPGQSTCLEGCAASWPAFSASTIVLPSVVNAADFTTITRPDGARQTAYKGMPLYYSARDAKRGDTNGQGADGTWFVAAP